MTTFLLARCKFPTQKYVVTGETPFYIYEILQKERKTSINLKFEQRNFQAILAAVVVVVAAPVAPPRLSDWSILGQLETEASHWSIGRSVATTSFAATTSSQQTPARSCAIHNFSNRQS